MRKIILFGIFIRGESERERERESKLKKGVIQIFKKEGNNVRTYQPEQPQLVR